jgi:phage terminase large subunit
MSEINPETYNAINDSFLQFVEDNPKARKYIFYGGAGSGKSVFIAMFICMRLIFGTNENILVLRKWLPALKISALPLILSILRAWGIFDPDKALNKSDLYLEYKSNRIYFSGLDNPEKIKSAEFTYIWIEEATDLNKEDYMQLGLRLGRAKGKPAKMLLSFNPIDQYHWLITDILDKPDDTIAIHHSTYLDNYENLNRAFIDELEGLIEKDENYYRVYTLGLPGILRNIIYSNYVIEGFKQEDPQFYGLDFGFNHPIAMTSVVMKDGEAWVSEEYYQRGKETNELIKWMDQSKISKHRPIYADSAEPDRIEMIKKAGYNIFPARKDVAAGIDVVKSIKLHINSGASNLISEIRSYKYLEKRDGTVTDEPVPFNDDLLDSLRYALFTTYFKNKSISRDNIPMKKHKRVSGGFSG